jgi:hypothetical protein
MGLSNAERQKRWRDRRNALAKQASHSEPSLRNGPTLRNDEELTRLRVENAALRAIIDSREAEIVKLKRDARPLTAEEYRLITSCLHSDAIAFLSPPSELVAKFDKAFIAFRNREGAEQEEKKKAAKMRADMMEGRERRRAENSARAKKAAATKKARAEAR